MENNTHKYKRSPSIRCRIIDLEKGRYSEDEKGIFTIFGLIRRFRIVGNLIYKKYSTTQENDTEDSMIKTQEGENTKISLLIDDGTDSLWINLWGINPENYQHIKAGDLVQVVGKAKKSNGNITVYPDFVNRLENPNSELLHDLEMIKFIKLNKKFTLPASHEPQENTIIDEKDINKFLKVEPQFDVEFNIKDDFSDEFDDFEIKSLGFKDDEIEEAIIETIKRNDQGDGVHIDTITTKIGVNREIIEDLLKKLSLNTKIYSIKNNTYKLYRG